MNLKRDAARGVPLFVGALGAMLLGLRIAGRFSRVEVVGESMLPALAPGDWLLVDSGAYSGRRPRAGDILVVADPRDPSRQLVKRVCSVHLRGRLWVEGDNASASTDSRHFGPIPDSSVRGRVVLRYWPSPRRLP